MTDSHGDIEVRLATLEEIIALRHAALLPGRPRDEARFGGDHDADTRHFGAFAAGVNIACASVMAAPFDGAPGWQLRGMATHADWRGRGVGRGLLHLIESVLDGIAPGTAPARTLWCNARLEAVGFYEKHGWRIVSDLFTIEGVGPHHRMMKPRPTDR
jgi:GNAT superfamily N-acetyltransferase